MHNIEIAIVSIVNALGIMNLSSRRINTIWIGQELTILRNLLSILNTPHFSHVV